MARSRTIPRRARTLAATLLWRPRRLIADSPRARRRCVSLAAACFGLAWITAAAAKEEPLLEFGLGAGAIAFEDYRGSDTTHAYPLPVPYFIYNGNFLKADREGVRGTLFNQDWVEINLSGNLTTPVRNDRARSGMPDLESTLEVGPSFDFHLFASADSHLKFDVRLPLRAASTVESSPHFIGGTFTPRLALDVADPLGFGGWHAGVLAGPLFADRRYNQYFYSVAPAYATASRPAYQATGGYAGTQTITALSKRFPRYWVGAYVRYDTLAGAAFEASPLVRRDSYWSAGFGFAWILHTSKQMVEVPD
jgi:outer membrane scaffolding protein for murein synthesis (MipA/OmpV family)